MRTYKFKSIKDKLLVRPVLPLSHTRQTHTITQAAQEPAKPQPVPLKDGEVADPIKEEQMRLQAEKEAEEV